MIQSKTECTLTYCVWFYNCIIVLSKIAELFGF